MRCKLTSTVHLLTFSKLSQYKQLSENKQLPAEATTCVVDQLRELAKICERRIVLIVLDDMVNLFLFKTHCS